MADRGRYIAAALTVVRAYFVAGRPNRPPPFGSYDGWSDSVRGALIWLGRADPVDTVAVARAEDPDLQTLAAVLNAWAAGVGIGEAKAVTAAQLLAMDKPDLREALDATGITKAKSPPKSLGKWLADKRDRIVGGLMLARVEQGENCKHSAKWYAVRCE